MEFNTQDSIILKDMDGNEIAKCNTEIEVVEAIIQEYIKEELCIGELLSSLQITGLSIESIVDVVGEVVSQLEGDELVHIYNTGESYTRNLKETKPIGEYPYF